MTSLPSWDQGNYDNETKVIITLDREVHTVQQYSINSELKCDELGNKTGYNFVYNGVGRVIYQRNRSSKVSP